MRLSRRTMMGIAGTSAMVAVTGSAPFGRRTLAMQTPAPPDGSTTNAALLELASYLPLSLLTENAVDGRELMILADYARRLSSVGVDPWAEVDEEEARRAFLGAMQPLPASNLFTGVNRAGPDAPSLFGWTLDQIDREASVMADATTLSVLQGRFDAQALEAAWQGQGYQARDAAGMAVYSLHEDASVDLESDLHRLVLSHANNVALIDPGILLYASTLPGLTAMIEAGQGVVPSLGADEIVGKVIDAVPEPLTGAMLLSTGAFLSPIPISFGEESLDFDDIELSEPGPLPLMGLIGFVSGPTVPDRDISTESAELVSSGSMVVASRRFLSAEEAEFAARRTLVTLETGLSVMSEQPWSDYFAAWRVWVEDDSNTVVVEADLYGNEAIWAQLVYARDASFLYG